MLKGNFQIESSRQSAERVLVRVVQDCFGQTLASVVPKHAVPEFTPPSRFSSSDHPDCSTPNQSPEPTPGSVTPRASERVIELEQRHLKRSAARGAPAPGVAHL
jgi:hypothetical protein